MANRSKNKHAKPEPAQRSPQLPQSRLWAMSHAPAPGSDSYLVQLLPAVFFTAFLILLVRMVSYSRPMDQFFWTMSDGELTDFFSYAKMVGLLLCAGIALLMLLFRFCTQSLYLKRSYAYIPMAVYCTFVVLSYFACEYKEFSLLGYNERFEGTLPLLAYMVMLFFLINTIDGERSARILVYSLVASSVILSLLGISQALDCDFFRTTLGQKLLVPNFMLNSGSTTWQTIDAMAKEGEPLLSFTFTNKEIYQTVYNINYVSFYLTLLIPLFGMLFIRSVNRGVQEPLWKKIGWGILVSLIVYNLIGSASSGGFLGLAAVGLLGLLLLNKRLLRWWKPVAILLLIVLLVCAITLNRWLPELSSAARSVLNLPNLADTAQDSAGIADGETTGNPKTDAEADEVTNSFLKPCYLDYIVTGDTFIEVSIDGEPLTIHINGSGDQIDSFSLTDADGNDIALKPSPTQYGTYEIGDDRFRETANVAYSFHDSVYYIVLGTYGEDWYFPVTEDGIFYRNAFGNWIPLHDVPHIGWENNQSFGSGRGYIWSRTLPMMKQTLLLGHGADTYCLYFPHEDYVGKYNSGSFSYNIDIVVDKPHNMYLGTFINTGGISVAALLALFGLYLAQSIRLYAKISYEDNDWLVFTGAGITFGIFGFLVSGLVNDSSISVMPMFYGLLGTGIAVNGLLAQRMKTAGDAV